MKRTRATYTVAFLASLLMTQSAMAFNPPGNGGSDPGSGNDGGTTDPDPGSGVPDEFQPVTDEYVYNNVSPSNSQFEDSAHFRIYHSGPRVADVSQRNLDVTLAHLEAAHELFVEEWDLRSPGLSNHDDADDGPYYKLNVYPAARMNAGGVMLYDDRAGLSYLEILASQLASPRVTVHEFGHSLTLASQTWVDQTRTGAWWETVANWVADTYVNSSKYQEVRQRYGLREAYTLINLDTTIGQSHLMLVSDQNYYEAWPFLTYLTNNPDGFPNLGQDTVREMLTGHSRNNETPLHVLQRVAAPTSVQQILGRYWARMAYLDIGHPRAQAAFFNNRGGLNFSNLDSVGNQTYRVKSSRQPAYGGANINPLRVTGNGNVTVNVRNLGNGLPESNFTATLAIRSGDGNVRYVDLSNGSGDVVVQNNEEVSLVVVNTPDQLYQYDAFESTANSPEMRGLNYEATITGAVPAD